MSFWLFDSRQSYKEGHPWKRILSVLPHACLNMSQLIQVVNNFKAFTAYLTLCYQGFLPVLKEAY